MPNLKLERDLGYLLYGIIIQSEWLLVPWRDEYDPLAKFALLTEHWLQHSDLQRKQECLWHHTIIRCQHLCPCTISTCLQLAIDALAHVETVLIEYVWTLLLLHLGCQNMNLSGSV